MEQTFKVDKSEVLRYLGHKGQPFSEDIDKTIDEMIVRCEQIATPAVRTVQYSLQRTDGGILLEGTNLTLMGKDVAEHLKDCNSAVLMAATLGQSIDREMRVLEASDMVKALVFDSCASSLIESVCDYAQSKARETAAQSGLFITDRFSPGYGDLALEIQPEFLKILDTQRKIGLYCTDTCLMNPRKSVTAIIGLKATESGVMRRSCENCKLKESCEFRKNGISCESKTKN
ncbi:MAG: methionine synthase [Oscillospiraceae bacterium]|nr:methionine synthase [Oscillospiraceae bacterium]